MAFVLDGFTRETGVGGAPINAQYFVASADGILTNEQALTASQAELNYVDGVTSAIQTQLNAKAASSHVHAESEVTNLTTDLGNKVDTGTTVNGHALSGNVTVTTGDIGAVPTATTVNGHALSANVTVTKGDVGLGNADDTSDAGKPVSTAQQTALDLKANLASPTFIGTPAVPTAALGTNTTQAASTAFVVANGGAMVKLAETVLAAPATTITFAAIPGTYRNLMIVGQCRSDLASQINGAWVQFNGDGGANYDVTEILTNGTAAIGQHTDAGTHAACAVISGASADANVPGEFSFVIHNYAATVFHKTFQSTWGTYAVAGGGGGWWYTGTTHGKWRSTAAITQIVIDDNGSDFIIGSAFTLYGIT